MDVRLRILLILTGLTGIHSITTVSKVSVKAGDSVTIPCLYDSQYTNHVKYLCKGYYWSSCSYAVKTNQRYKSGKYLFSDESRRIFTVTIRDLTDKDTDYWCAVEIGGGSDVREYFHLSVAGTPSLYVDHQEITGFNGEKITINCRHINSGVIKWCRLGSSCVTERSGSIDGTRVTINTSAPNVFTVTLSEVRTESSGWYLCVKGDLQMPVHVTVTEKPTANTLSPTETETFTPGFTDKAPTTVQGGQHSASVDLEVPIIPLSLFVFIVMVALFIWFMLKKHKRNKAASSAMTATEEDTTYCIVEYTRTAPSQRPYTESDVHVAYSSVATMRPERVRRRVTGGWSLSQLTLGKRWSPANHRADT